MPTQVCVCSWSAGPDLHRRLNKPKVRQIKETVIGVNYLAGYDKSNVEKKNLLKTETSVSLRMISPRIWTQ